MRATSVVTVLLPLVPVMPITGAWTWRANSSTSPSTGMRRARAARAMGSSSETPGEINTCEAPSSSDISKPPSLKVERIGESAQFGEARRRAARIGGHDRDAALGEIAQARCARLAETDDDAVHQRIFKVARPTNTSTKLMIQKRTITFGSAHPLSSK